MGFAEVLPRLPQLHARFHQTLDAVAELQPQVVIGIDSKAFCLRMLRALADRRTGSTVQAGGRAAGRPSLLQYVAPSVWAFGDAHRRATQLVGGVDELLALLPRGPLA